ncbi:MAG: transcription factor [Nitrososphaerota archaeon]
MPDFLLIIDEDTVLEVMRLVGGEEAVSIVRFLIKNPSKSDEEIASALGMNIKDVRKILHKLIEYSLLTYEVAKDKDTGHRIFRWRVQQDQVLGYIKTQIRRMTERLRARLEYERSHQFYYCGTKGCRKYTFEEAVDKLFKCPVCNNTLNYYDNSRMIEALTQKLQVLEKAI